MSIQFKKTPLQKRLSGRAPFAPAKPAPERPPLPVDQCPGCGSVEIVRITPATPGPIGWGGRCKGCGHRWSIDIPAEPDFSDADGANRLAALHAAGLSVADDDGNAGFAGRTEEELQRH